MNLKEIKEIIALMNENGLAEIEVEREGSKIKIKKTNSPSESPARPAEYQIERQNVPPSAAPDAKAQQPVPGKPTKEIASPMVGTFYRASSPEAPPFVEVGQIVEVGQVVCIIEAMKLMNEIKSEVKGKVTEVIVDNAEPVEFGQILFVVEPV